MSKRNSKEFWLSKRAKNQGNHPNSVQASGRSTPDPRIQPTVDPHFCDLPTSDPCSGDKPTLDMPHVTAPYSGGQRTPIPSSSGHRIFVPSPSGSPTVNPSFGPQSTPDPRTSGQRTRHQQPTSNPYPAGQRILQPNSSGQSINDGVYIITNIHHNRFVYLEDPNDNTPLRGHYNPENRSSRWQVRYWGNEQYWIQNVDHGRYANCESRPRLEASVEGHQDPRLWRIRESFVGGQYTIAAIDNWNLWKLPDNGEDTPVSFSKVPTDPMCRWTFDSAAIVAPVNENHIDRLVTPDTRLPLAPSVEQPMHGAAIVEFTSVITEAPDLLQPLGVACKALRVVLQSAESIGHVNEDRKALTRRLHFHLATIENDIAKLEEDQGIDETIPALDQDVRGSLETYARELKEIYENLLEDRPGVITKKPLKIDEAFQEYTAALRRFTAKSVAQIQQQLVQFLQEFQHGAHTAPENAHPSRHNAFGIQHRECLQGTREKTLSAIGEWVDDANTEKWIFFFLDVAGSGKSTVAKHMTEKWKREERLLARFFFSRDTTETMSTNSFCSTVAGAFADLDEKYMSHMKKFKARPNVELFSFEERFDGLVAAPLRATCRPAILIIDALDECNAKQRDELLGTLRDQHGSIPLLRILATGRPERDIKRWAEEKFGFGYTNFARLKESDKDVELYIKHTLRDVPGVQDRLYPVIRRAEGLFIWARIACDLLLDSDDIDGLLEELGKEVSLDYLYQVALEQSMPKEGVSRRAMLMVLQMILAAKEPLSIAELELLSPKPGVVEKIVTRLGSVLLYQGREDAIRLLHATFREFLTTRSKTNVFFIQPELGHHTLALGCLTTILDRLKDSFYFRVFDAISKRKEISVEKNIY